MTYREGQSAFISGWNLGDTTTLADASVVNELQRRAAEAPAED